MEASLPLNALRPGAPSDSSDEIVDRRSEPAADSAQGGDALTEAELRRALDQERAARGDAERRLIEKEQQIARHDVLMREIDHRVKNSLQLVASMLALQARRLPDGGARRALDDALQRIASVAAMHQQLYRVSDLDRVDLGEFLAGVCASLAGNKPDSVEDLSVHLEPVVVGSRRAMKLGMLVSELVTNAFKHAYPAGRRGSVRLRLAAAAGAYRLVVADDGVGIGRSASFDHGRGLGMRLVRSIVEQMGATLTVLDHPGATFVIDIPDPDSTTSPPA